VFFFSVTAAQGTIHQETPENKIFEFAMDVTVWTEQWVKDVTKLHAIAVSQSKGKAVPLLQLGATP
jgi:hypothetical protein